MHCEEIKFLLSSYMDDELTDEQRLAVREHLASCAACKIVLTEYELLSEKTAELAPQTPDMLAGFDAQVEAKKQKRAKHIRTSKWVVRASAMAAALVLVVLGSKLFTPYGAMEASVRSDNAAAKFDMQEPGAFSETQEEAPAMAEPDKGFSQPRSGMVKSNKPLVLEVSAAEAQAMKEELADFYSDLQLQTIITPTEEGYVVDFSQEGLPIEAEWQTLLTDNNTRVVEIIITE